MTGVQQLVTGERQNKMRELFDEKYASAIRTGNHLWLAHVSYHVQVPLTDGTQLDVENMAMPVMVGCFICEQPYTERLAKRRCTGEPKGSGS